MRVARTPRADWREDPMVQTHGHHPRPVDPAEDPVERRNLLADPAFAEVLVEKRKRLGRRRCRTGDSAPGLP